MKTRGYVEFLIVACLQFLANAAWSARKMTLYLTQLNYSPNCLCVGRVVAVDEGLMYLILYASLQSDDSVLLVRRHEKKIREANTTQYNMHTTWYK